MKSIRTKILASICVIVLISLVLVGSVSSILSYKSTLSTLELTLSQTVTIAANQVSGILTGYKNLVTEFANNNVLISGSATEPQKIAELNWLKKRHNFEMISMSNAEGILLESGADVSDRDYFQKCRDTGEPYVSDPAFRKDTGTMALFVAAPVMRGDTFSGVVVVALDAAFLSDIVSTINVGDGNSAILNRAGNTIGYADQQLVLDQYNTQQQAATDPSLTRLAEIEAEMCAGQTGFAPYSYGGVEKIMTYCPIPGTDGWSIDIAVVNSEFMGSTYLSIAVTTALAAAALLVAAVIAFRLASSIAGPIKASAERLRLLADGDLKSPVPAACSKDETSLLANSMASTVSSLNSYILDMEECLGQMAGGNLDIRLAADFKGDFVPLRNSMEVIADSLNSTLFKINIAADQVAVSSNQVSSGAQALSRGATQQAASVEELAATIDEIARQVKDTATNAIESNERTREAGDEITLCNGQMQELSAAMNEISASSSQIGKIIKTIEDIAFQTNILALNAAVEAARAGAAGKGFAVVADEVRNLAGKSAEAAKNTTALIEDSIKAVSNGTRIAGGTARSLLLVVEKAEGVLESVGKITGAAKEQADSIAQVKQGVEQISNVVQTNSATAQQSAAASEELSGQAQTLKSLVGRFRLQAAGEGSPAPSADELDWESVDDDGRNSKY